MPERTCPVSDLQQIKLAIDSGQPNRSPEQAQGGRNPGAITRMLPGVGRTAEHLPAMESLATKLEQQVKSMLPKNMGKMVHEALTKHREVFHQPYRHP